MATPPTERNPQQQEHPDVEQPTKEPTGRFEPTAGRTAAEATVAADGSPFLRRPQLRGGKLPDRAAWVVLGGVAALVLVVLLAVGFNPALFVVATGVLTAVVTYAWSWRVEGPRKATDRLMTVLVTSAFVLACLPLVSLIYTV